MKDQNESGVYHTPDRLEPIVVVCLGIIAIVCIVF